ncbi:hypothetical protein B0H34DRAFT_783839 [Crassisporium funariophilum]|nr:hypothetical protein B0H34DRAFT_783839 [Crassisporium funariophilum]
MTIAVLRSLHSIIGDALDDIERVYASHGYGTTSDSTGSQESSEKIPSSSIIPGSGDNLLKLGHRTTPSTSHVYASPPPSPSMSTHPQSFPPPVTSKPSSISSVILDFPSLDIPCDPQSLSEGLTKHPDVLQAISRIIAAAGQMSATVQTPFLTICDAVMGYHLPSCMRILEASHVVEILREGGHAGLHVEAISKKNGIEPNKLAHILRLLATHHILREVSPDVFALNRISSLVDSGKSLAELKAFQDEGRPEQKYQGSDGIAAFVGLCTDEIQKSSAYMTETYYLSASKRTREGQEPTRAPFCFAFDTVKTKTGFFGWLEDEVESKRSLHINEDGVETGRGGIHPPTPKQRDTVALSTPARPHRNNHLRKLSINHAGTDSESGDTQNVSVRSANRFRLERFGKAMTGTASWEAPGAILNGFDWQSLPKGSVVVDVGGGIGSTSRLLATAFSSEEDCGLGLKFIIQDRPVVVDMGVKAWKEKCPELLESAVKFEVHDFFTPQPVRNAAVFLLRVVLHDWPDDYARRVLLQLREAATPETKLLIADFVLPLACPDDMGLNGGLEGVEGAESILAPAPLLPNLGKANANVYWMDLTMQVMFNSQERTLREIAALASSAGWKVIKVTKTAASLFGHIVAVPIPIPMQKRARAGSGSAFFEAAGAGMKTNARKLGTMTNMDTDQVWEERSRRDDLEMLERSSSRCGTPTFGSRMELSSVEDALARYGGGVKRTTGSRGPSGTHNAYKPPIGLKPAVTLAPAVKKKKPSPLSVPAPRISPPLRSPSRPLGPPPSQQSPVPTLIKRRMSLANLRPHSQQGTGVIPPLPPMRHSPPSPMSPRHNTSTHVPLSRRGSYVQLSQFAVSHSPTQVPLPSFIPVRSVRDSPPSPVVVNQRLGLSQAVPGVSRTPTTITRRSSCAQFPQVALRKRSGTVIGLPMSGNSSPRGEFNRNELGSMSSTRICGGVHGLGRGATVLRFDTGGEGPDRSGSSTQQSVPEVGLGVLAAAARIERGEFRRPTSP